MGALKVSEKERMIHYEIETCKEHQKKHMKNNLKAGIDFNGTKTSELPNHPINKLTPI